MKKYKQLSALFTLICIMILSFTPNVYANNGIPQKIRVGLERNFKNISELNISSNELRLGFEYNDNFLSSAVIRTTGAFSATPANMYYIKIEQYYSDYNSASQAAAGFTNSGFKAQVALLDNNHFAVYLGGYASQSAADGDKSRTSAVSTVLEPNNRRVCISNSNGPVAVFDNNEKFGQIAAESGESISLKDKNYRGVIELVRKGSAITPVNVLTMDEYLFSVVPSEMPSKWHPEALKAQAIACRNYAVTRMGIHNSEGYHLCDKAHCQVYLGSNNEAATSTAAVNATSGIMAYYDNAPINAVFFTSSGGATANSETVWANNIPYLRSVYEINETTAIEWQRSFSLSEITSLLTANNYNIGQATKVSIEEVSTVGRVNKLVITGTNGSAVLEKEAIRNFFASSSGGALESRNFSIGGQLRQLAGNTLMYAAGANSGSSQYDLTQMMALSSNGISAALKSSINAIGQSGQTSYQITSNQIVSGGSSTGDTVVFTGKGRGHGVGMSQHGANGMAEAGYTYTDILKHYYTGIEIR